MKCPYKYCHKTISNAAMNSDVCLMLVQTGNVEHYIWSSKTHMYTMHKYVQGQVAITGRHLCDVIVQSTKDIFVHEQFRDNEILHKLTDFYNNCFAPAIVSPVHILGMKLHDLRMKYNTILKCTCHVNAKFTAIAHFSHKCYRIIFTLFRIGVILRVYATTLSIVVFIVGTIKWWWY